MAFNFLKRVCAGANIYDKIKIQQAMRNNQQRRLVRKCSRSWIFIFAGWRIGSNFNRFDRVSVERFAKPRTTKRTEIGSTVNGATSDRRRGCSN